MTHDELLALIDDSTNGLKHDDLFEKLLTNTKALRAVVELHKPSKHSEINEFADEGTGCSGCGYDFDYAIWVAPYPCPTIRAIEKELQ
jgi:predicted Zn-ribbon and HTH transcriptional regulator